MMPGSKVPKHNSSDTPQSVMAAAVAEAATAADSTTETALDRSLCNDWSPNRNSHRPIRVRSLDDGNIRGGHWVLDQDGNGTTIAFLWKNTEEQNELEQQALAEKAPEEDQGPVAEEEEPTTEEEPTIEEDTKAEEEEDQSTNNSEKIYGLTTGHNKNQGDAVFVFLHSEPTETTESCCYELLEIGEIVSKDEATDSAVFEVTRDDVKGRFDFLRLDPKSGLGERELRLPRPSLNPTPPEEDSSVVIYGAATRGNYCSVSTPRVGDDDVYSARGRGNPDEIGFERRSSYTERPTQSGDCGALYLDCTTGLPVAMHHAMDRFEYPEEDEPDEFESYGFPLSLIMAKHPEQFDSEVFGTVEAAEAPIVGEREHQDETNGSDQQDNRDRRQQAARTTRSFQIKKFPVTIPENPSIHRVGQASITTSTTSSHSLNRRERKLARTRKVRSHQIAYFDVTQSDLH